MSRGTALLLGALLLVALFGRSWVGGTDGEPDLEPLPVARVVADDAVDLEWVRTPDGRDPFEPIVLPAAGPPEGDPGSGG